MDNAFPLCLTEPPAQNNLSNLVLFKSLQPEPAQFVEFENH